ncbi:MAG: phospholipase, partial [Calditrichaeota bacterium]
MTEETTSRQIIVNDESFNFLLYLPKNYEAENRKWPLLIFLHGAGERGKDLEKVKIHGPPKLIEKGKSFPFIVVSPQCPEGTWWELDGLNDLLQNILKNYRVDLERIYLTGLSMGGFGTWAWAMDRAETFAALAPICGGGDTERVCLLKDTHVWVFHGRQDKVVPVERSVNMVNALRECGGNVKFTIYPEAGHDSWSVTYDNPDLYKWFLK